jgi:3-methyladenine DNA glycosylase/8-oxoguanine DNA glycosylase
MPSRLHVFRQPLHGPKIDFPTLLFGHGWIFLAPNAADDDRVALTRTLRLPSGNRVQVRLGPSRLLRGTATAPFAAADRVETVRQCRRMLRLDEDLTAFHELCRDDPVLGFVRRIKAGRLLRSPTVFEDVVKTLCTTNCAWANTKRMVDHLCRLAGGVFPDAPTLVAVGAERLRSECRLGYRADYVHRFARQVTAGECNPEAWLADCHTEAVYRQIQALRGVGPYALHHILMLLGRYDLIPVDSEVRQWIEHTHFRGRSVPVKRLLRRYERFAPWQFLAYKFERIAMRDNYIN